MLMLGYLSGNTQACIRFNNQIFFSFFLHFYLHEKYLQLMEGKAYAFFDELPFCVLFEGVTGLKCMLPSILQSRTKIKYIANSQMSTHHMLWYFLNSNTVMDMF